MVNPFKCTDYNRSINQLEEFLLFAILIAGKRADYISRQLEKILQKRTVEFYREVFDTRFHSPFKMYKDLTLEDIIEELKGFGIGCYKLKGEAIYQSVHSNIDLENCSSNDLELIKGIGRKTSRYFVLHTQIDAKAVPLDTHMLKYLKDSNVPNVPKNTPSSKYEYYRLENEAIKLKPSNQTVAEFDLNIWRRYTISKT